MSLMGEQVDALLIEVIDAHTGGKCVNSHRLLAVLRDVFPDRPGDEPVTREQAEILAILTDEERHILLACLQSMSKMIKQSARRKIN